MMWNFRRTLFFSGDNRDSNVDKSPFYFSSVSIPTANMTLEKDEAIPVTCFTGFLGK